MRSVSLTGWLITSNTGVEAGRFIVLQVAVEEGNGDNDAAVLSVLLLLLLLLLLLFWQCCGVVGGVVFEEECLMAVEETEIGMEFAGEVEGGVWYEVEWLLL
jgi:hypothetical protein